MCFISIFLNLIRCLSRYHGKRQKAASNRQLCCRVWMNHLCNTFKAEAPFIPKLAAYSICSARVFTPILYVKKKKKKEVSCVTNFKLLKPAPSLDCARQVRAFICFETCSCFWHIRQNSARTLSLTMRVTRKSNLG